MRRRDLLRLAGAGAAASATGCLGLFDEGHENARLPPPDYYDTIREAELPYPIYGEPLPEATVDAPLHGREVSTHDFVGDRHVLLTFIFTRCPGVCPGLTANLVQVQSDAAENGYTDDVALMAVTFDPVYDTAEVLDVYADDMGVDRDADNFYFLRPDGEERVNEVVVEKFGHAYSKTDMYSETGELEHDHGAHDGDGDGEEHADGHEGESDDPAPGQTIDGELPIEHFPLFILANSDGYVERSYRNTVPTPNTVIDDVQDLVEVN